MIKNSNISEKISVIIPIYNVQDYLTAALNSLKNQTYRNFEVIMIDDASTDNSFEIAKTFTKDFRFKLFSNNVNRGLSITRNRGIDLANGEYIFYFDPDDLLPINLFELLITEFNKSNADLLCFNNIEFSNIVPYNKTSIINIHDYDSKNSIRLLLCGKLQNAPWAYMTRLKLLKENTNIRFPKHRYYEDITYTPLLMNKIHLMRVVDFKNGGYFYRKNRKGSITAPGNLKKLTKKINDTIYLNTKKYNFLMKNYADLESYIKQWYFNELVYFYEVKFQYLYTIQDSKFILGKLRNTIIKYVNKVGLTFLPVKDRLKFLIIKYPILSRMYYRFIIKRHLMEK